MFRKWYSNWLSRHRNRTSFVLHMVGIPAAFVAAPVAAVMKCWLLAAGFFFGGYALQFLGHLIEGNRSGEEELIRRLFRRRRLNSNGVDDEQV
ncbi:MAG: Mpo1-like protein [Planctomycetota bacterium]|nr:Mpo1-like protein [Planctomycetota bacterium]